MSRTLFRLLPVLLLLLAGIVHAAPHVFWASDPVRPGEVVVAVGDGLSGAKVAVEAGRSGGVYYTDAAVLQASDQSLKFVLPETVPTGVLRYQIGTASGTVTGLLNRPELWWGQGQGTVSVAPGGLLRLFGKNLTQTAPQVRLQGPKTLQLPAQGDGFALKLTLPATLPAGEYRVSVHNGTGFADGWSAPLRVRVEKAVIWPQKVFSVRDFGADGQGQKDDSEAIRAALAAAEKIGGGVVYFPRGRYQVNGTLELPRHVTLRGEKRNLTALYWPDVETPPTDLLKGTDSFALEELTFYCSNYNRFLSAAQSGPEAGKIKLRRLTVRANRFRGHMTPDEADRRLRTPGGNQCPLLVFGGADCEITDCDLYSSGMVFWLSKLRGAFIARNRLSNGRWGWYSLSGNDGVIFEDNRIFGGDLMATGGGLNTLDGSNCSQHVYYARNTLRDMFGWDREAMTSDAGGGAYFGKVASSTPTVVTLAEDPKLGNRDWKGSGLYIMDGKGAGQYRRVVSAGGREVTVDAPWQVAPDATSTVTMCAFQGRCLFIGNDFADAGVALQFYGNALEHICAGNTSARTSGFHNFGMMYSAGIQPNWYLQWLDNRITEGNIYRGDHDNWRLSGEAHIGVYAFPPQADWQVPLTLGTILRRNELQGNAHVMLGCEWNNGEGLDRKGNYVRDVLVENTSLKDADLGVFAYATVHGLVLRGNRFVNVKAPLSGPGLAEAYVTPADRAMALRVSLQALFRDLNVTGDPTALPAVATALRELPRLAADAPRVTELQLAATLAALSEIGRQKPAGLPLRTMMPYLGLKVVMPWSAPLHNDLQNRPTGGPSRLDLNVTASVPLPPSVTLTGTMTVPPGWTSAESAPLHPSAETGQLQIPVTVPDKEWAGHDFPVSLNLKLGANTLRLNTTIMAGSGYIRRWMLLGPFTNKSGEVLDSTVLPPEDGIDLAAEYDGMAGKIRWTPWENGDWVHFKDIYKPATPGVAFAVACVTSPEARPAELRLGASGGTVVYVNGCPVWSTGRQHWNGPAAERVPIELQAGDNVIMLKLCGTPEDWTLVCELGPRPGGPTMAGVVVQSPATFAGRACFKPPVKVTGDDGAPLQFTAGVPWKLVYADDFGRDALGGRWRVGSGQWKVNGAVLQSSGVAFLAYAEKLKAPWRIEYEGRVPAAGASDISAAWLANPADFQKGVLIGFGANGNALDKILNDGEQVAQDDKLLVKPGAWHRVIAQVLADGRVQLYVDGRPALEWRGKPTLTSGYPCLWAWESNGQFRKVRIYSGPGN